MAKALDGKNYQLVITGHSLGAGTAALVGLKLKARFPGHPLPLAVASTPTVIHLGAAVISDSMSDLQAQKTYQSSLYNAYLRVTTNFPWLQNSHGYHRESMLTFVGLLKPCRHFSHLPPPPPCRCEDVGVQPPGRAGHPEPEQGSGYLLHQPGGGQGRCQPGHCQQSEQVDG